MTSLGSSSAIDLLSLDGAPDAFAGTALRPPLANALLHADLALGLGSGLLRRVAGRLILRQIFVLIQCWIG